MVEGKGRAMGRARVSGEKDMKKDMARVVGNKGTRKRRGRVVVQDMK